MQNITSFKEGDWVDETYLVSWKQVATAKNGVVYLSLKLADKTGEIDARLWDNAEDASGRFGREDFVHIKGIVANYQGSLQIKMKTIEKVDDSQVDLSNFLQSTPRDPEGMVKELRAAADDLSNRHLRQLMMSFLNDTAFMDAFKRAPAARTLHHNYIGGLLEHVVDLIGLCGDVVRYFPDVDRDLVMVGAFIHDIGKVRELSVKKSIEYTTEGRLIGHISLGYEMLVEKIRSVPGFPSELVMLLKHIMLSHHGEYEFGSPKRPKIQEAVIIHYLDDLSAKLSNFQATIKKENVAEGEWSSFNKMHERYLYRPSTPAPADTREDAGAKPKGPGDGKRAAKEAAEEESSGKLPLDI